MGRGRDRGGRRRHSGNRPAPLGAEGPTARSRGESPSRGERSNSNSEGGPGGDGVSAWGAGLVKWLRWPAQGWATEARLLRWLTMLWLVLGVAMLLSASYVTADSAFGDGLYYVKRQLLWIAIGILLMRGVVSMPLQGVLRLANGGLLLMLLLTWSLLVPGVGRQAYGAVRWVQLGPIPLQPSEFLKPLLVLQSARMLGAWERLSQGQRWFWLGTVAAALVGILLQPNLSTTLLCGMVLWLLAIAAGLPWVYVGGAAIGGVMMAALSISLREYQQRRILSFLDPWADPFGAGYQLVQSLLAIGSGGWWGAGFGLSRQKLANLPIQYTDFIFSVYAEEFGWIGSMLLLGLLGAYGWIGLRLALKARDRVMRLVAVGTTAFLIGQSMLNVGVAAGALPTTGLPFPMLSYGGSSMLSSLILAGLLIRTAREVNAAPVVGLRNPAPREARSPRPTP
jgi:cell division protein FtsW